MAHYESEVSCLTPRVPNQPINDDLIVLAEGGNAFSPARRPDRGFPAASTIEHPILSYPYHRIAYRLPSPAVETSKHTLFLFAVAVGKQKRSEIRYSVQR
jgi:hypothetical protein